MIKSRHKSRSDHDRGKIARAAANQSPRTSLTVQTAEEKEKLPFPRQHCRNQKHLWLPILHRARMGSSYHRRSDADRRYQRFDEDAP